MVVRNGWFVWRRRHARPAPSARLRWWMTTALLAVCQLADAVRGPGRRHELAEVFGRIWGMLTVLLRPPKESGAALVLNESKAAEGVVTGASNA
jgi:hypothetical protein